MIDQQKKDEYLKMINDPTAVHSPEKRFEGCDYNCDHYTFDAFEDTLEPEKKHFVEIYHLCHKLKSECPSDCSGCPLVKECC